MKVSFCYSLIVFAEEELDRALSIADDNGRNRDGRKLRIQNVCSVSFGIHPTLNTAGCNLIVLHIDTLCEVFACINVENLFVAEDGIEALTVGTGVGEKLVAFLSAELCEIVSAGFVFKRLESCVDALDIGQAKDFRFDVSSLTRRRLVGLG